MTHFHVNKVILVGELLDPIITKKTKENTPYLRLRISTTEYFTNVNGETKEATSVHTAIIWGEKSLDFREKIAVGDIVMILGNLQTRAYDKQGHRYWSTQVNAQTYKLIES